MAEFRIDPNTCIDHIIERMVDLNGLILPVDAEWALQNCTQEQISTFCYFFALYQFPTKELIDFLRSEMDGHSIEICAGNGVIGRNLQIQMFDNKMQERDYIMERYTNQQQPSVVYGPDVVQLDGIDAIKLLSPRTVIASWCTQQWKKGMSKSSVGNIYGVDEQEIFRQGVHKYIHVGNELTHNTKIILRKYEYREVKAPWLLSRSMSRDKNVIYVF